HDVRESMGAGERPVFGEAREELKEQELAVGVAQDETQEARRDLRAQAAAHLFQVRDIAVVRTNPASILEGMAIQDAALALRRLAHVGQHRLRSHDAAQPMKQRVTDSSGGTARQVGATVDVVDDAPTVGVLVALHAERVLSQDEGPVDLTWNDAAEAEEPAHAVSPNCGTLRRLRTRDFSCSSGETKRRSPA